jgi:hypothetical protein
MSDDAAADTTSVPADDGKQGQPPPSDEAASAAAKSTNEPLGATAPPAGAEVVKQGAGSAGAKSQPAPPSADLLAPAPAGPEVGEIGPGPGVDLSEAELLAGPGGAELEPGLPSAAPAAPAVWPSGEGEMARLIRYYDWSTTPLGPLESWPQSLRSAVDIMLRLPLAAALHWGRAGIMLYNDAYALFAGWLHPWLLGRTLPESWPG